MISKFKLRGWTCALALAVAVLAAGCGKKKERFPAQGTPAVLFRMPSGWISSSQSVNSVEYVGMYSPDKMGGAIITVFNNTQFAVVSYKKMAGFLLDGMGMGATGKASPLEDVVNSGINGKVFEAAIQKDGSAANSRVFLFRLNESDVVMITSFSRPGIPDADKTDMEALVHSIEIVPGLPAANGATPASTPTEVAREMIDKGNDAQSNHDDALAITTFSDVLLLEPNASSDVFNNLAWLLATTPQTSLRDGKKAVQYATRACESTQWKEPEFIDTLAAACAEAGDFPSAVKYEQQYISAPNMSQDAVASGKQRLALYQEGMPYRDVKKE